MHHLSRTTAGGIQTECGRSLAGAPGGHAGERGQTLRRGTGAFGRMVGQGLGNEPGQMRRACAVYSLGGMAVATGAMMAQTPAPVSGPTLSFTATTDHVAGAPDTIRIDLLRWSTDAERAQL